MIGESPCIRYLGIYRLVYLFNLMSYSLYLYYHRNSVLILFIYLALYSDILWIIVGSYV